MPRASRCICRPCFPNFPDPEDPEAGPGQIVEGLHTDQGQRLSWWSVPTPQSLLMGKGCQEVRQALSAGTTVRPSGLFRSEAILAASFEGATPAETVRPVSVPNQTADPPGHFGRVSEEPDRVRSHRERPRPMTDGSTWGVNRRNMANIRSDNSLVYWIQPGMKEYAVGTETPGRDRGLGGMDPELAGLVRRGGYHTLFTPVPPTMTGLPFRAGLSRTSTAA